MASGWFRLGSVATTMTAFACSVSPVPEPPAAPELGPGIGLGVASCDRPCDGFLTVRGGAGATKHASHVWGAHLDAADPPVEAEVNADGSFILVFAASLGSEIRLQARRGAARSAPRDFRVARDEAPNPFPDAPRPFRECFPELLEVELESPALGSSTSRTLSLRSSCSVDLEITSVRLRTPHPAFSVESPAPLVLASGGSLEVPVAFAPSDTSTVEEVLLIEIAGPERDRRAVTLFGRGRE